MYEWEEKYVTTGSMVCTSVLENDWIKSCMTRGNTIWNWILMYVWQPPNRIRKGK